MRICFDLDGVLCNNTFGDYEKAKPNSKAINKINSLFDEGNYIIIFTARYMDLFKGNINKVNSHGYKKTETQLASWGVKYNELILGKPEFDIVIDDKNFNYSDNWINEI